MAIVARRLTPRPSLRLRLLGGAALGLAAALVASWLAIGSVLRGAAERAFDARLDVTALALMGAVSRDADTGELELDARPIDPRFEAPLSGWYWALFETGEDGQPRGSAVQRSRSLWDASIAAPGDHATGPAGEALRVDERRFTAPGGGGALLVRVAGPRVELEAAERAYNGTLTLCLALLGAALLAASTVQVVVGLRPLGALGRSLAAIRIGQARRLPPARHAEVEPLVRELNTLLDHDEALVERSRRNVGNLAHALQTPLAALANLMREPGRDPDGHMAEAVGRMQAQISHQLRRARLSAAAGVLGARVPLAEVLEELAPVLRAAHRDRGIALSMTVDPALAFAGDRQDLEEMLGNLLDNAMKWAATQAEVTATGEGRRLFITVSDDGPGMRKEDAVRALAWGSRLDQATPGHGLGLAIVAEAVEAYGGLLLFPEPNSVSGNLMESGLEVVLELPRSV